MALYDNAGRIPRRAAESSLLALFVIAVLSGLSRFAVRLYYQRKLFWDDALLGLAILMLCTCVGLLFHFVDDMYLAQSLMLGQFTPDMDLASIVPRTLRLHKLSDVVLVLTWTSLCTVKLSFLLFFRTLTTRTSRLRWYWWGVLGYTVLTWMGGVPMEIVSCPYFDERALTCAQGDKFHKTVAIAAGLQAVNISSDLLIISIPVIILHRINIPLRTKFVLGTSLCLSVMTIAVTLIRVAGLKAPGVTAVDVVWQVYWTYVEVCIGIIIVSATAFRTFFVQRAARHTAAKKSTPRSQFAMRFRQKLRFAASDETDSELGGDLKGQHIPGATITGLRTFINDNGKTVKMDSMASGGYCESEDKEPLRTPEIAYKRM